MRSRDDLRARPGFFEVRKSSRHPWVAARVERDLDGRYSVTIGGVTGLESWTCGSAEEMFLELVAAGENAFRHPLLAIWLFGREVDEETYNLRLATAAWAQEYVPDHPAANPDKPIDLGTLPVSLIV